MCIRPQKIINKRYLPNKKNNFNPPKCTDKRLYEIEIPCGQCVECRKQKARDWSIRLREELKRDTYLKDVKQTPLFVTLTFSDEKAKELAEKHNIIDLNDLASKAIRLMLERFRKKNKVSFKHWFITELGEQNGRLHLHGIIWLNINQKDLEKLWGYGFVYIGEYVSPASINYITNYSLKLNNEHAYYKPKVCATPGLGKNYLTPEILKLKKFNGKQTQDYYTLPTGQKITMPKYYRNKIYTDEEREQLYLLKMEEPETVVCGIKVDKNDVEKINKLRENAQKQEDRWGLEYGKAAKYNKLTVNQIFDVDDTKRIRQKRVKKVKTLKDFVPGERIFHENFNEDKKVEFDWEERETNFHKYSI